MAQKKYPVTVFDAQSGWGGHLRSHPNFSVFEEDDRLLASKGVQVMRKVYDGKHEWQVWRECARDFLPLLFQ